MINPLFMNALAKLESVASTDKERTVINDIRGEYVKRFAADNSFVNGLAQLESVAATSAEKHDINAIRGMFGLFHLTGTPKIESDLSTYCASPLLEPMSIPKNLDTVDDDDEIDLDYFDNVDMPRDPGRMMLDNPDEVDEYAEMNGATIDPNS
jgi:hypothetical protein